jgi:hypothetical protein
LAPGNLGLLQQYLPAASRTIGVSIVSNVLTHREQFHQSRLVESVLPSSVQYQDTLHRVTDYFVAQGNSLLQAQQQAICWYAMNHHTMNRSRSAIVIAANSACESRAVVVPARCRHRRGSG